MAASPYAITPNILPFRPAPKPNLPGPIAIELPRNKPQQQATRDGNALKIEIGDGSVLIDLNPQAVTGQDNKKFDANLAMGMDGSKLAGIARELLRGIDDDNTSRQEWLNTHAEGIKLLGLIIEESRGAVGESAAPLEGMSTVRHPMLLEAVLLFQANAVGALLPAAGPVKVRDDETTKPSVSGVSPGLPAPIPVADAGGGPMASAQPVPPVNGAAGPGGGPIPSTPAIPQIGPNGGAPLEDRDALSNAFEKDFNHYLTAIAKEYYPDTRRMMFGVGFGGQGIKKVYNCPIRRRPVSESINIEDFIVSNALTDLGNAARITHRSKMRPSTLRRLQILGVYRDVDPGTPTDSAEPTAVDQAKAQVIGVAVQANDPKDADYEVYECCCELILDEFAPRQFKGKQLPLPYRVTMERQSEQVLEIRRNWKEDDPQCLPKQYFVEFPFVKAFGWYGIGLLHILGNTEKTLTAAWREMVDSGMFANFPGFVYDKALGRQLTNLFRIPPGGGQPIDVGMKSSIKDAIMPLPYKDLGPAFTAFIQHVEENGQRLGGTAQINVAESRQDAPVGTTLALLEQAGKPTNAVLKGLLDAQATEFQLLKERFREDPEAFWRFNKKPAMPWQKDQFLAALEDYDLIPVADPNNPTALHRAAKADFKMKTATAAPALFDLRKVWISCARDLDIDDPESLLADAPPPGSQPQGPPPKPLDQGKMAELQLKAQGQQTEAQQAASEHALDLQRAALEAQDRAADREAKIRIAMIEQETERLRLASTLAIHSDKTQAAKDALTMKLGGDQSAQAFGAAVDHHGKLVDAALQAQQPQQTPTSQEPQT